MKVPIQSNGLIARPSTGDFGDGAAETYRFAHLLYCHRKLLNSEPIPGFIFDPITPLITLRQKDGQFANPGDLAKNFSADQHMPMLMYMGAMSHANQVYPKGPFFQNGDLKLTREQTIMRCFKETPNRVMDQWFWPTVYTRCGKLPFWDSGLKQFKFGDPNDVADVLNLVHSFLQCEYTQHTKTSENAMRYFAKNITMAYHDQLDDREERNKIMYAIRWYYKGIDDWGIVDLYRPLVEHYFL